jgi:hypothetical protein
MGRRSRCVAGMDLAGLDLAGLDVDRLLPVLVDHLRAVLLDGCHVTLASDGVLWFSVHEGLRHGISPPCS